MLTINLSGTTINAAMLMISVWRRYHIGPEVDALHGIAMRRAVRQEGAFFASQMLLLALSIWTAIHFEATYPLTPPTATIYYVGTIVSRTAISLILATCSVFDFIDRARMRRLSEGGDAAGAGIGANLVRDIDG